MSRCPAAPNCPYCDDTGERESRVEENEVSASAAVSAGGGGQGSRPSMAEMFPLPITYQHSDAQIVGADGARLVGTRERAEAAVRAINCHDELVEALRALWRETDLSGNGDAKDYGWPNVRALTLAALAKARGETPNANDAGLVNPDTDTNSDVQGGGK